MLGSKRKAASKERDSVHDIMCGRKRHHDTDDENRDHNIMTATDESTTVRKLKRGIKACRKNTKNPAEVAEATKEVFFGVTNDKFTSMQRFKIDLSKISKSENNKNVNTLIY